MEKKLLPEGYRYEGGYVGLKLPLLHISPEIEIDGEKLAAKTEFHMSIFAVKRYAPILAKKIGVSFEEAEEKILEESNRLLIERPIAISGFKDEIRIAEEQDKKTMIVMCTTDGTEDFFAGVRKSLDIEIPTQPFHVTLYKRPDGQGIGLASAQEVVEQTRLLTPEETEMVKAVIHFDKLGNAIWNSFNLIFGPED